MRILNYIKLVKLPPLSITALIILCSVLLATFYNLSLWQQLATLRGSGSSAILYGLAFFLMLTAVITLSLSIFGFKHIIKPLLVTVFIVAAMASHFMDTYGMVFSANIISSIVETDAQETAELGNWSQLTNLLTFGFLPVLLVILIPVYYQPFRKELRSRMLLMILSMGVLGTIVAALPKTSFSPIAQTTHLQYYVNPVYPLYALVSVFAQSATSVVTKTKSIGDKARRLPLAQQNAKKTVVIFVVGESARRGNFSLNGYGRDTNPHLRKLDIINYTQMTACGTSTTESLPCMFSHLPDEKARRYGARHYENMLDVLQRVGIKVLWRDNNTGCKGLCMRVEAEDLRQTKIPTLCKTHGCYDEVLLNDLQLSIDKNPGDVFIVLHQVGSHGPAYHKRYPREFARFSPECRDNQLKRCTSTELTNAYDNSILYTDYFLSLVIAFLEKNSERYHGAMIYVSDHGESLGENGKYLHGLPIQIAPTEQLQIPMLMWFSKSFISAHGLNRDCLKARSHNAYSHSNLFHSMLGLFRISATENDKAFDLFSGCMKNDN